MDWLIENEVARCGKTKEGLNIFYFRSLGYWVSPPILRFTRNKGMLVSITYNEHGKENKRTTTCFDARSLRSFLKVAVFDTLQGFGLYRSYVTRRDFQYRINEKRPFGDRPGMVSVTIMPPLREKYKGELYRAFYDLSGGRADALARVQDFAARQIKEVKEFHSATLEDYATFSDKRPV